MHKEEEEIQIRFISYAHIPFKAEIEAENLRIDWGDGQYSNYARGKHFHTFHTYAHEGLFLIRITGTKITYAHFSRLSLSGIRLHHCPALEYLDCSINELKELELSQCPRLEELYCNSNNLEKLYFNRHPHLSILNVSYNILKNIDVSGCCNLQSLYCSNNRLSQLELKTCMAIHHLDVSHNLFGKNELNKLFLQLPERKVNATLRYAENPGTGFENSSLFKVKKWR